ncbi:UNVERIFIED_CONTAM: hypothetical protein NCL1_58324 [Trichonephila clavipes]
MFSLQFFLWFAESIKCYFSSTDDGCGPYFYFQLANLALFSNTTKTRLLSICSRKGSGFRYPHNRAGVGSYLSHCSCKGKYLPSKFSFLFQ